VPVARMSLLPVWVWFHHSVYASPLAMSIATVLPSPCYKIIVLPRVDASTLAMPSLFPPSSVYLSAFACSSCHAIVFLPLSPKMLSPKVGLL